MFKIAYCKSNPNDAIQKKKENTAFILRLSMSGLAFQVGRSISMFQVISVPVAKKSNAFFLEMSFFRRHKIYLKKEMDKDLC